MYRLTVHLSVLLDTGQQGHTKINQAKLKTEVEVNTFDS